MKSAFSFRTVLITLALTALAILIACVWMALAIQNDLFQSRRNEVLDDSRRATVAAQATLDAANVQGDRVRLQNLMRGVGDDIAEEGIRHLQAINFKDRPVGAVSIAAE